MSPPIPSDSRRERRPSASLGDRLFAATTRLILIAIVAGGLLTVAANLHRPGRPESEASLNVTDAAAPIDIFLREGLPITREIVTGDEAAAREAVVRIGRETISQAVKKLGVAEASKNPSGVGVAAGEEFIELARDREGMWSIRQVKELPRIIVGVATTGAEPTIVFRGGYDETGPGEWTVWTMLLPRPEK